MNGYATFHKFEMLKIPVDLFTYFLGVALHIAFADMAVNTHIHTRAERESSRRDEISP